MRRACVSEAELLCVDQQSVNQNSRNALYGGALASQHFLRWDVFTHLPKLQLTYNSRANSRAKSRAQMLDEQKRIKAPPLPSALRRVPQLAWRSGKGWVSRSVLESVVAWAKGTAWAFSLPWATPRVLGLAWARARVMVLLLVLC